MSCQALIFELCFEQPHEGFSGHCEKAVTKALLAVDAHAKIVIDRTHNKVEVDSDTTREALAQAIAEEGYRVAA